MTLQSPVCNLRGILFYFIQFPAPHVYLAVTLSPDLTVDFYVTEEYHTKEKKSPDLLLEGKPNPSEARWIYNFFSFHLFRVRVCEIKTKHHCNSPFYVLSAASGHMNCFCNLYDIKKYLMYVVLHNYLQHFYEVRLCVQWTRLFHCYASCSVQFL